MDYIYIDCFNLKSAGGLKQLSYILALFKLKKYSYRVITNRDDILKEHEGIKVYSILHRDILLLTKSNILYLSNIPPVFKPVNYKKSIFLLHHRYWVDPAGLQLINGIKSRIKIFLKRTFFNLFYRNVGHIIVQTEIMNELCNKIGIKCLVYPLFDSTCYSYSKEDLCLIVGDNTPHKRSALKLEITNWLNEKSIPYVFVGYENMTNSDGSRSTFLHRSELNDLYSRAKYIYIPSWFESFGYPLIEAAQYGCCVIVNSGNKVAVELLENTVFYEDLRSSAKLDFQPSLIRIYSRDDDFCLFINNVYFS